MQETSHWSYGRLLSLLLKSTGGAKEWFRKPVYGAVFSWQETKEYSDAVVEQFESLAGHSRLWVLYVVTAKETELTALVSFW